MEAAYESHLADEAKKQRLAPQVPTPNPKTPAAKAPATPAGGARQVTPQKVDVNDSKALNAYLDKLTPDQQKAFWVKALPGAR
mgnify:CR=1 FL=1